MSLIAASDKYACVGGPFGSKLSRRHYVDVPGVPVIRGKNLGDTESYFHDEDFVFVSREKAKSLESNMAHRGDIVFTQRGTLGQVGMIPSDARFDRYVVSQSQMKLTVDPQIADARFVYAYFRSPRALEFIQQNAIATGVPHINLGILREFPVPVPPIEEQKRIAAVLGALDDKIELNRKMNQTLEEMAQTIFKSWFIDFDGEDYRQVASEVIATGILTISDGYRAKRTEFADDGLPFARAGDIRDGIRVGNTDLVGWRSVEKADHKVSRASDVVFTSKGTIGRFAFVTWRDPKVVYSPQLCFWRSDDHERLNPYFLLLWMQSGEFLRQVAAVAGQTDMAPYVSLRDQRRMLVALPPSDAQTQLGRLVAPMFERIANNRAESDTLAELRDALLPKLISGEIRVPEAEEHIELAL